ncbi:helix-turn-helix domain-containing protein [Micromonospora chersina]|uniref:helix-turn-helix domain-containing protein n=1 Tax=Micromonospora chersina TaxID=47854 RepID=UPI003CA93836
MLAPLGLDPVEEEIYRQLIASRRACAAELAAATGRSDAAVRTALAGLVDRGLAGTSGGTPGGDDLVFVPAPPAVALNALLRQRQDDLRRAESDVAALAEQYRTADVAPGVIEVVADLDTVRRRFFQIQEAARHEVLSMVPPDLRVVPHRENTAERASMKRGVRYRALLDRRALTGPDMQADIRESMALGQEIRIVDAVPVKMMIVDGEIAMLPLHHDADGSPASILVYRSGLLAVLVASFEAAWERAYPLRPAPAPGEVTELTGGELGDEHMQVLALLLSGQTDQAVATQLDISLRTVHRRIRQLMNAAGVDSRVQLGWAAARNGWA